MIQQAIHDVTHGTHSNYLRRFGTLISDYQDIMDLKRRVADRVLVAEEQLDPTDLLDSLVKV